ncbi:MAG TPA: SAM-dependent methyltransferase [Actinocrinis sp.]
MDKQGTCTDTRCADAPAASGPYADGPCAGEQSLGHDWQPPRLDTSLPHPGRMFNYMIGGKDNFRVDRDAVGQLVRARPDTVMTARAKESFIRRSVVALAEAGLRQFIQFGQSITFVGSGGHAALWAAADLRSVVYVADDPISLAHARALLADRPGSPVAVVDGDFRDPERVLADPRVAGRIDPAEPVGLLLFGMLDFIASDRRARRALDYLLRIAAPGSMAAVVHITEVESESVNNAMDAALSRNEIELIPRSPEHVRDLMSGYRFLDPGLVPIVTWRPDPDDDGPGPEMAARTGALGGVICVD